MMNEKMFAENEYYECTYDEKEKLPAQMGIPPLPRVYGRTRTLPKSSKVQRGDEKA